MTGDKIGFWDCKGDSCGAICGVKCRKLDDSSFANAAVLLGIKQSWIFQIVETGVAHFTEAEAGALMNCLISFQVK